MGDGKEGGRKVVRVAKGEGGDDVDVDSRGLCVDPVRCLDRRSSDFHIWVIVMHIY